MALATTNDNEISSFISKIGNDIVISNEKDETVVNHLLEIIANLTNDKTNLINTTNDLKNKIEELTAEILSLTQENSELIDKQQYYSDQLKLQKEHIMQEIHNNMDLCDIDSIDNSTNNDTNSTSNNHSVNTSILDKNELDMIKDGMETQLIRNYSTAMESNAQELLQLERQLDAKEKELKGYKDKLIKQKNLEDRLEQLENELIETRDTNFIKLKEKDDDINEQKLLISEQLSMIKILQSDINSLENTIDELNIKLSKENNNTNELLDLLKLTETQMSKQREKRDTITLNLRNMYSGILKSPLNNNGNGNGSTHNLNLRMYLTDSSRPDSRPQNTLFDISETLFSPDNQGAGGPPNGQFYEWRQSVSGFKPFDPMESRRPSTATFVNGNSNAINQSIVSNYEKQIEELKLSKVELINTLNDKKIKIEKLQESNSDLIDEIDELKQDLAQSRRHKPSVDRKSSFKRVPSRVRDEDIDVPSANCVFFGREFW